MQCCVVFECDNSDEDPVVQCEIEQDHHESGVRQGVHDGDRELQEYLCMGSESIRVVGTGQAHFMRVESSQDSR